MPLLRQHTLEELSKLGEGTMAERIGIEITEIGDDYLKGRMRVDARTLQPYGILHGGASAALAETLGSIAGALALDPEKEFCVGMEINANHVRSVRSGFVYGKASPLHIGKKPRSGKYELKMRAGILSVSVG